MIRRSYWLALGLAALVGCDAAGPPKEDVPARTSPTPATSGDQAPPPTDAAKGQAPGSTGGLSPAGPADSGTKSAEGVKSAEPKSAATVKLSDEEVAHIKELPEPEQAAALEQKVCPISDEHLGSMDKPVKVEADGKTAFLCCGSCKKAFLKDPKAALAKLGK